MFFHIINKITGTKLDVALLIRYEDGLRNCDEVCLRNDYDTSVELTTNRVLVVGHNFILSDLKKLVHSNGLKWHLCTSRSGKAIKCNRVTHPGSRVNQGLRNITSITCGCKWSIYF